MRMGTQCSIVVVNMARVGYGASRGRRSRCWAIESRWNQRSLSKQGCDKRVGVEVLKNLDTLTLA